MKLKNASILKIMIVQAPKNTDKFRNHLKDKKLDLICILDKSNFKVHKKSDMGKLSTRTKGIDRGDVHDVSHEGRRNKATIPKREDHQHLPQ